MSQGNEGGAVIGSAMVFTTDNGGHPPEFWAKRLTDRIMYVSQYAPPPIRDQAQAFKDQIEQIALFYIKEAIRSDRSTREQNLINQFKPKE